MTLIEHPYDFDAATVDAISERQNEPAWMREARKAAWQRYESMNWPEKYEVAWRRINPAKLPFSQVKPVASGSTANLREALLPANERSGWLVQSDGAVVHTELDPALAQQGVVLASLANALQTHSDRLKRYLTGEFVATPSRYHALHEAFWSGGALLYVPANVVVDKPLVISLFNQTPGAALFPKLIVVAERFSSFTVIEDTASEGGEQPTYISGQSQVHLMDSAHVNYMRIQEWAANATDIYFQNFQVGRDARLDLYNINLGGQLTRSNIEAHMIGSGAQAELKGIYMPANDQYMEFDTFQNHVSPNAMSNLLFKGALKDQGRSTFSGLIRVAPHAQNSDAFQVNRNLLLDRHSHADSIPNLEINANEVRCTHAASVGPVEVDYLHYLMARGLPRAVATRMIVEGFLGEVIDQIPVEAVQFRLRQAINKKLVGPDYTLTEADLPIIDLFDEAGEEAEGVYER